MSNATINLTDLATNLSTDDLITELDKMCDEFNRKLGKLDKAGFLNVLGDSSANYYGVDATLIVMGLIDQMFEGVHFNESFFTYGLTARIDAEIARLSE